MLGELSKCTEIIMDNMLKILEQEKPSKISPPMQLCQLINNKVG
jgi:hypothetical protein